MVALYTLSRKRKRKNRELALAIYTLAHFLGVWIPSFMLRSVRTVKGRNSAMNYDGIFSNIAVDIVRQATRGVSQWRKPWSPVYFGNRNVERVPVADAILDASGARFIYRGSRAAYSPSADLIGVPHHLTFKSTADFYSTVFHEMGHWSGHPRRLNRSTLGDFSPYASALEEMTAEFTSAFITGLLGMNTVEQHAAYITGFYNEIGNPNALSIAAAEANRAATFILGKSR